MFELTVVTVFTSIMIAAGIWNKLYFKEGE